MFLYLLLAALLILHYNAVISKFLRLLADTAGTQFLPLRQLSVLLYLLLHFKRDGGRRCGLTHALFYSFKNIA